MKKTKLVILIFIFLPFIFIFSSCRIKAHDWTEDGCDWICDDPQIIIFKSPITIEDDNKRFNGYLNIDYNCIKIIYAQDNTLKNVDLIYYISDRNYYTNDDIIFSAEVNLKDDLMYWYITYSIYDQYLNKTFVFYKENIS